MSPAARSQRRSSLTEWLKQGFTASTLITILTVAGGFVATEARRDAQQQEVERRLAKLESTYVPRAEQESKDAFLRDVLRQINDTLDHIESVLMHR